MKHRLPDFVILFISALLIVSCTSNPADDIDPLRDVKPPIETVTGEACPILEQDLFKTSDKEIFNDCDLRRNPKLFDDKLIRITSDYGFMIHGSFLSGASCPELPNFVQEAVSVGFKTKSDYDYIEKLHKIPVNIIAVGKFSYRKPTHESDTIYDNSPYHFQIVCLEKTTVDNKVELKSQ